MSTYLTVNNKDFRNRTSVLIAFHKLLKAAKEGSDVFLLDMRDKFASRGLLEYNDESREELEQSKDALTRDYGDFIDQLAEAFVQYSMKSQLGSPKPPSQEALRKADELLCSLLHESCNCGKGKSVK